MFVSCSQYTAQLASCFSLHCRLSCWTGFAVSLHPTSFWASLRHPGSNTADLYMMVNIYVCKTGIWFRAPPDRVQLTPSWVLYRVQGSLRTRRGQLTWMEMGMDRIIAQHFILLSHFQLHPLTILSRTKWSLQSQPPPSCCWDQWLSIWMSLLKWWCLLPQQE